MKKNRASSFLSRIGACGLLLQCLVQIVYAPSQFPAKPGVLDRDRRRLGSGGATACGLWRAAL
jgi:hypothetical protein